MSCPALSCRPPDRELQDNRAGQDRPTSPVHNDFENGEASEEESEDEVDGFSSCGKKADELDRYLSMELEKTTLDSNMLSFWKQQQNKFPLLSRYARSIHSIPATSASVERQFSGAG